MKVFTKEEIKKSLLLYAITDSRWLKTDEKLINVCKDVLDSGATFLQIREKDLDPNSFAKEAEELRELCNNYNIPFVVNDSIEIAKKCSADGVHLGQSDIKGKNLRQEIGKDMILGISAGTVEEAKQAEEIGADYIGVGSMFHTGTKDSTRILTFEDLKDIVNSVSIPVVAIGGLNIENISQLKNTGIDGIAVVSAIFAADDKKSATKKLLELSKEVVYGE
ncbi:MAG: thiamine phosphate synthase [Tissierellia bacterium]|nr:thiamine phosphate synthase [Tissierellia bacterium]